MSEAGVTLMARVALVTVLIVATAVVRAMVGPSRRRHLYMGVGTVAGMAAGVALASVVQRWTATDVSTIFACLGIVAGWRMAWRFARQVPREAR